MAVYRAMLVLCGPPGVGKTTIGRICAQLLGCAFLDTDEELSARAGLPVSEILRRDGEAALRARERALVSSLSDEPRVLSVGGGFITSDEARTLLLQRGFVCGLAAAPSVLLSRLRQSGIERPLLLPDPERSLPPLLLNRESAYADVHVRLRVDDWTARQSAEAICGLYRHFVSRKESATAPRFGETQVQFGEDLPSPDALSETGLLIVDERIVQLAERSFPSILAWIQRFPYRYVVEAGEALKDIASFPRHVERLLAIAAPLPPNRLSVIAMGGGSVGDFAGFFASVFKRGVSFQQVPSTWLAAVDSAHGGKNALNVGLAKNQLGTIAPAARVMIARSLLSMQPVERAEEAMGELAKIALLDGGDWVCGLLASPLSGADLLWESLPDSVAAKYRIVGQDPQERLGIRHRLNLGHTVGHVLETVHGLPHGVAVAQGLYFALHFSAKKGFLSGTDCDRLLRLLADRFALLDRRGLLPPIPYGQFVGLLSQDKKRTSEHSVRFVFLRGLGIPDVQPVALSELAAEAISQGYVEPAK